MDEAAKLKAKATEIRGAIPPTLATADIQGALQKILEDEARSPDAVKLLPARPSAASPARWSTPS